MNPSGAGAHPLSPTGFSVILLAAGFSRRFGSPKISAHYRGVTLLEWILGQVAQSEPDEVILVVQSPEAVAGLVLDGNVRVVINPTPKEGLGSSLATGAKALPADCNTALVVLADQPLMTPQHFSSLVKSLNAGVTMSASGYSDGSIGVPAAFDRSHFATLKSLNGDKGAKALLNNATPPPSVIPVPSECQLDIDTTDDLDRLTQSS